MNNIYYIEITRDTYKYYVRLLKFLGYSQYGLEDPYYYYYIVVAPELGTYNCVSYIEEEYINITNSIHDLKTQMELAV